MAAHWPRRHQEADPLSQPTGREIAERHAHRVGLIAGGFACSANGEADIEAKLPRYDR